MSDRFGNIPIQPPTSTPKKTSPPKKRAARRKKTKRHPGFTFKHGLGLLLLPVLLIVYSLAGFFGVPYYINALLPSTVFEKTGLFFKTGHTTFNPYTFSFQSENIFLKLTKNDNRHLLFIKSLSGKLSPLHLLRNDIVCNDLTIIEPDANLIRNKDKSYNFSPLFQPGRQKSYSDMMNFSDLPFHFSLNNIQVTDGSITFIDQPAEKTHSIKNIQLALPSFSNLAIQADNYIRPHFSATVNGSPVDLSGEAGIGSSGSTRTSTDLVCNLTAIDLPLYLSYLPFSLPFSITKGKADGKIGLKFDPQGEKGRKLAVRFILNISKANILAHNNTLDLAIPRARLEGTLNPVSQNIHLDTVSLTEPVISSFGRGFVKNISSLLNTDSSKKNPVSREKSGYTAKINSLTIKNGTLKQFTDSEKNKIINEWTMLQLEAHRLSTREKNEKGDKKEKAGTFTLTGTRKKSSASFAWKGKIIQPTSFHGTLTANHLDLNDLAHFLEMPPLQSMTGTAALKGELALNLTGREKNKKNNSFYQLNDATVTIRDFQLSSSSRKKKKNRSTELSAERLIFEGFNRNKKIINFGRVRFEKGILILKKGQLPEIFSFFTEGKYKIQSLQFKGRSRFIADKASQILFPDFSIKATALNRAKTVKNNLSLSAKGKDTTRFTGTGSIRLTPFRGTMKTEFAQIPVKALFPWFSKSPLLRDIKGLVGGKGTFTFPGTGFTGTLHAGKGSLTLQNNHTVSWAGTVLHGLNYAARPFHLGIALVELQSPSLPWTITKDDDTALENFAAFLQSYFPMADRTRRGKKTVTLSPVDIQEIVILNGQIALNDTRTTPPWKADISQLKGRIRNIHSGMAPVISQLQFSGKLDDSPFTVEAQSDLFSAEKNGSFSFNLDDLPLASFHHQISPVLDINTGKGDFGLEINSYWEDSQLSSSGKIHFSEIEPVSPVADSAMTLALLEGTDNSFSMDLSFSTPPPVAATSLFDRILVQFQKHVVKSSVSPFLLARGDFTDLIDNEMIEFIPGEFMLSDKGRNNLSKYGALLINHPNISLVLSGNYDEKTDRAAMKKQMEEIELKRVDSENKKKFAEWKKQKEAYYRALELKQKKMALEGKIMEQDIPPEFLHEFVAVQPQTIQVNQAMLEELARKRAKIVQKHLTSQLQLKPERIQLQEDRQLGTACGVSVTLKPFFQMTPR
ncbi:DUF748 domain-containing protein [Desulfomarina sp.]